MMNILFIHIRDPNRINRICQLLEEVWFYYPDQRIGQFTLNYVYGSYGKDSYIYFKEDDDVEIILERFL